MVDLNTSKLVMFAFMTFAFVSVVFAATTITNSLITADALSITGDGDFDGDLDIDGNYTGNFLYGELYDNENSTIDIIAPNVWANFTNLSSDDDNGFTLNGYTLTVEVQGVYKMDHSESVSGLSNRDIRTSVGVNGEAQEDCEAHRTTSGASSIGSMGGTCIVRLSVGEKLTLMGENKENSADFIVEHATLNVVYLGK
jgi:hypothetical protein